MCAHAQVPTSPTFGCKSRCSQACIKLSTIPSPNKPASTVSVTTKETLDKKNTMYNKHSCQESIILLKKKPHHTNMSSEQNFYIPEFQYNLILPKIMCFELLLEVIEEADKREQILSKNFCKASCSAFINKLCGKNLAKTGRCFSLGTQPMILQNIYFVQQYVLMHVYKKELNPQNCNHSTIKFLHKQP